MTQYSKYKYGSKHDKVDRKLAKAFVRVFSPSWHYIIYIFHKLFNRFCKFRVAIVIFIGVS